MVPYRTFFSLRFPGSGAAAEWKRSHPMPQQAPIQSPKGNSRRSRRNERSLPGEDGASRCFWWENHLWMEDFHCYVWLPVWLGKNNGINGRMNGEVLTMKESWNTGPFPTFSTHLPSLVPWLPSLLIWQVLRGLGLPNGNRISDFQLQLAQLCDLFLWIFHQLLIAVTQWQWWFQCLEIQPVACL